MGSVLQTRFERTSNGAGLDAGVARLVDALQEWEWIELVSVVTSHVMRLATISHPLPDSAAWENLRDSLVRAGIWSVTNNQVSRAWIAVHIPRFASESGTIGDTVELLAREAMRLAAQPSNGLPANGVTERGATSPDAVITISASDLEDLLDFAAAEQRVSDSDEDDWIPWDEIKAGLNA